MYSRGIQGEKKRRYCGPKGGEVEKGREVREESFVFLQF